MSEKQTNLDRLFHGSAEEICRVLRPTRNIPYTAAGVTNVTPEEAVEAILRRDIGFVFECLDGAGNEWEA